MSVWNRWPVWWRMVLTAMLSGAVAGKRCLNNVSMFQGLRSPGKTPKVSACRLAGLTRWSSALDLLLGVVCWILAIYRLGVGSFSL